MQTETIKVSGMTCGGCSSKVAHALKAVAEVQDVVVSLPSNESGRKGSGLWRGYDQRNSET